jgi:hypothetical protein
VTDPARKFGAAPAPSAESDPNTVDPSKLYSSNNNTSNSTRKRNDAECRILLCILRLVCVEIGTIETALSRGVIPPGAAREWLADSAPVLAVVQRESAP